MNRSHTSILSLIGLVVIGVLCMAPIPYIATPGGGGTNNVFSWNINATFQDVVQIHDTHGIDLDYQKQDLSAITALMRTIDGSIQFPVGFNFPIGAGAGKVLISDALGNASWTASSSLGGPWTNDTAIIRPADVNPIDPKTTTNSVQVIRDYNVADGGNGVPLPNKSNPGTALLVQNNSMPTNQAVIQNWPDVATVAGLYTALDPAISNYSSAGVLGEATTTLAYNFGTLGVTYPTLANTNVGAAGIAIHGAGTSVTGDSAIGGLFAIIDSSATIGHTNYPVPENAGVIIDTYNSGFALQFWRTNNGTHVASIDQNGLLTANGLADNSGTAGKLVAYGGPQTGRLVATNIEQIITNVTFNNLYSTNIFATNITAQTLNALTNIFNLAKGSTLILSNTLSYITNVWPQGPTGIVQFATNYVQNFVSASACSITGVTGAVSNQLDTVWMTFDNTSTTNWNLTLQSGIVDLTGISMHTVFRGRNAVLWLMYNPNGDNGPETNCLWFNGGLAGITNSLGIITNDGNGAFGYTADLTAAGLSGLTSVRTFDIPMGAWFTNNCGNGADVSPASMLTLTNSGDTPVFTVNATTTNELRTRFSLPSDWNAGTVQVHTFWACSGTNSASVGKTNIVVHYDAAAVGAADRLDNLSFGTAVYWTNNVNPFPWEQGTEGITSALTIGNNPAKGKGVIWRIQVDGNAAGTTETNSSLFLAHVTVEYQAKSTTSFSTPQ